MTSVLFRPDDSGDEEPTTQSDRSEIQGTLKILVSKLDDLSTCNDLIAKHGAALQRSLSELEGLKVPVEGGEKIKAVNERATLFRITSNAMINVSSCEKLGYKTQQEWAERDRHTLAWSVWQVIYKGLVREMRDEITSQCGMWNKSQQAAGMEAAGAEKQLLLKPITSLIETTLKSKNGQKVIDLEYEHVCC